LNMAPRIRRNRYVSKHTASANKIGSLVQDIENICCMPLPSNMAGCIREIEVLAERQRAVSNCMRKLLSDAPHETKMDESTSSIKVTDQQINAPTGPKVKKREFPEFPISFQKPLGLDSAVNNNKGISDSIKQRNKTDNKERRRSSEEEGVEIMYKESVVKSLTDVLGWSDQEGFPNEHCSPLINALKQLQHNHLLKKTIKKWIYNLADLFRMTDEDKSGYIDADEYRKMVSTLRLSEKLKYTLFSKFEEIDKDRSGNINLNEFLHFFLLYPKFNEEVLMNAHSNAPYSYEAGLTFTQKWRLSIYNIVQVPDYNTVSKIVFCLDVVLTMIPTVCLCLEATRPSFRVNWGEEMYYKIISIFFAIEYACGLLTCRSRKAFVTDFWNIIDLVSFAFWIIYNTILGTSTLNLTGFVIFRTLRIVKLYEIFDLITLRKDLEIYTQTISLVYTSYGAVTGFMIYIIIFFSLLMYVFERGSYDEQQKIWIRDGENEESPFSDLYDCVYFTIVTITTVGYGDMSPKTYVGKLIALIASCVGICNLTFLINIIGECFEEIFRIFVLEKSRRLEEDWALYIDKHILRASDQSRLVKGRSAKSNDNREIVSESPRISKRLKMAFINKDLRMGSVSIL